MPGLTSMCRRRTEIAPELRMTPHGKADLLHLMAMLSASRTILAQLSNLRRPALALGAFVAMTATGVGVSSCGEEEEGSAADDVVAHLRECNLLTDGEVNTETYTGGSEDDCLANCVLALTCPDAYALFCSQTPNTMYSMCQASCAPKCADGVTPKADCDGVAQCPDMSDEANCPVMMCADGTAYTELDRCDGFMDCTDGADEAGCPAPAMYTCANGMMVAGVRCNSFAECADQSDETGCAVRDCSMPPAGSGTPSATTTVPAPPPSGT